MQGVMGHKYLENTSNPSYKLLQTNQLINRRYVNLSQVTANYTY